MKQEIKDQIRQMADERHKIPEHTTDMDKSTLVMFQAIYSEGAEAVMQRLDIDINAVHHASRQWGNGVIDTEKAKQQILNAITLK